MATDELLARLRRLYAAIDAAQEKNLTKFPSKVARWDGWVEVCQDFSGGRSEAELSNAAHTVIHNIANFRDNLRRWAEREGKEQAKVKETFSASMPLRIIQDLSNNDKHGYPPERPTNSGLDPKLKNIRGTLVLTVRRGQNAGVLLPLRPGAVPQLIGSGTGRVAITGDVFDRDGRPIGDLYGLEKSAVATWEQLLVEYGVCVKDCDNLETLQSPE